MPNLRDIKNRIKSVKNTQKITQAMKMVAAAKVKKAENSVKAARPFSNNLIRVFKQLLASKPEIHNPDIKFKKPIENYPELLKVRKIKNVGLLVITSDKGLAGAFNANVVKKTINTVKKLTEQGIGVKLFVVGNKGITALSRQYAETEVKIEKTYSKLPAIPTVGASSVIAEDMALSFVSGDIDKIEIITTKFKSMLSYNVELLDLLPVIPPEHDSEHGLHSEMLFEPTPEKILQKIVPLYVANTIYESLLESAASELAARMNAMSNATTNAQEMIQGLTITYNKARQASITQEILEVVSGANALEG